MYEYSLSFEKEHLFMEINSLKWLIDTGAPSSFAQVNEIDLAGRSFSVSENYMGLTAGQLSEYIGTKCHGLIGVDILNQFDLLIDLNNYRLTVSIEEIKMDGNTIQMNDFMGIPIVSAKVGGEEYQLFFDTGAKISYLPESTFEAMEKLSEVKDFYPGFGTFVTSLHLVEVSVGDELYELKCGSLPSLLNMTLTMASTQGILGNELCQRGMVGYFPRRGVLCLGQ